VRGLDLEGDGTGGGRCCPRAHAHRGRRRRWGRQRNAAPSVPRGNLLAGGKKHAEALASGPPVTTASGGKKGDSSPCCGLVSATGSPLSFPGRGGFQWIASRLPPDPALDNGRGRAAAAAGSCRLAWPWLGLRTTAPASCHRRAFRPADRRPWATAVRRAGVGRLAGRHARANASARISHAAANP